MGENLAPLLEQHRAYLMLLARLNLGTRLRARVDPCDVVQQTLLEAHRSSQGFSGAGPQLTAWLRSILACQLARITRDLHREKRDVSRECSLQTALEESSARLEAFLAAEQSSPSQQAQRNEWAVRVAAALETLPEDQREALLQHYYQGRTVAEVAQAMERSAASVAGLLQRGLKALRRLLAEKE
jgi:RNA polymerase sigma-70 factor (ECF subfamily)